MISDVRTLREAKFRLAASPSAEREGTYDHKKWRPMALVIFPKG